MMLWLLWLANALCLLQIVSPTLISIGDQSFAARLDQASQYAVPLPRLSKGFLYSTIPYADATCDGVLDFLTLSSPNNITNLDSIRGDFGVRVVKLSKAWDSAAQLQTFSALSWPASQRQAAIVSPLAVAIDTIGMY